MKLKQYLLAGGSSFWPPCTADLSPPPLRASSIWNDKMYIFCPRLEISHFSPKPCLVYFGEKWYFKATALGRLMTMSWSLFLGFFCGRSCNVFKAIPHEVILRLPIQSKGFTAPFLHDICISFLPCLILKNTGEDRMKICPNSFAVLHTPYTSLGHSTNHRGDWKQQKRAFA